MNPDPTLATARASRDWHPVTLLALLAAWLATAGNLPLWSTIARLPETRGWHAWLNLGLLMLAFFAFLFAFLGLLVWPRWRRVVGVLLLLVVTVSSHYMLSFGVVVDPTMLVNVVQTDWREARDLMSGALMLAILAGVGLPGWWWWRRAVRRVPPVQLAFQQLAAVMAALVLGMGLLWLGFQDLASLMRNHKSLRYMANPFNTVYAVGRLSASPVARGQGPLMPVGEDARLRTTALAPAQAPLIVLVVGETARAANFGLGGYARDTTPRLRQLHAAGDLLYFPDVRSCGTNTQTSVPCMFSHLGREAYGSSDVRHETLMDVLQRAGLATLWIDNQSGCKGVCDRIPNVETRAANDPRWCQAGECLDEIMLEELPRQWQALDPQRRARGTVVVLHQMGSHGPAYHKRSPAALKAFLPECERASLPDCSPQQIVNAYDNSIRYTDHFLARTIEWLRAQNRPAALLYVSDHGESLGERGLYLHGMPYAMAPDEQTHVPMLAWLSPSLKAARGWPADCLRAQTGRAWSHDHLFHTVLGLAQVETQVAKPALDILAPCATAGRL